MNLITRRLNKKTCDRYSIFDRKISSDKLIGIKIFDKDQKQEEEGENDSHNFHTTYPDMDNLICMACNIKFENHENFRSHYQLDSHTENVKLKAHSNIRNGTENENLKLKTTISRCILFTNRSSEFISICKCVLFAGNNMPKSEDDVLRLVDYYRKSKRWAILMYTGGKFAGAIFDENKALAHKTIRRYTVRAKQGGSQSLKDKSCGGMNGPKSAGANLRRYCEKAIKNDIGCLLHSKWLKLLQSCDLIFLWSSKCNSSIFHSKPTLQNTNQDPESDQEVSEEEFKEDQNKLLPSTLAFDAVKNNLGFIERDQRIRLIPYTMYNVTYARLREMHQNLSQFEIYDETAEPDFLYLSERKQIKRLSESGDKVLQISQSGRYFNTPLNYQKTSIENWLDKSVSDPKARHLEQNETDSDCSFVSDDFPEDEEEPKTSESPEQLHAKQMSQKYEQWYRKILVAISANDVELFLDLLPDNQNDSIASINSKMGKCGLSTDAWPKSNSEALEMLNMYLNDGRTLLHVAVECQTEPQMLLALLKSGCNPSLKNSDGKTIFSLCQSLGLRQLSKTLRKFREMHPDMYDYSESQIPEPLTEAAKEEKKNRKEVLKKQLVEKQKRAEIKEIKREEEIRYSQLSDREKRALAAERRIKNQYGSSSVKNLCNQCSKDITGMVPFTYDNYCFCSSNCLKAHRIGK